MTTAWQYIQWLAGHDFSLVGTFIAGAAFMQIIHLIRKPLP